MLGPFSELVLVVIGNIENEPTATEIHDAMAQKLPDFTLATLYVTLDRLLKRKLIARRKGQPLPERGGKARYFYKIEDAGRAAVMEAQKLREAIGPLLPRQSAPRQKPQGPRGPR